MVSLLSHSWALLALPLLASAHFHLKFPAERGFSEESISNYPCGGFNTPSKKRADFPISGGPVWINNEHTSSLVQVVLAVKPEPNGDDFVYTMLPTVSEIGPNDFCVKNVAPPREANVTEGTKGTIMVITSGHGSNSGLYSCGDVTFVKKNLTSSDFDKSCKNSAGVQYFKTDTVNANGTQPKSSSSKPDHGGAAVAIGPSYLGFGLAALAATAFTSAFALM